MRLFIHCRVTADRQIGQEKWEVVKSDTGEGGSDHSAPHKPGIPHGSAAWDNSRMLAIGLLSDYGKSGIGYQAGGGYHVQIIALPRFTWQPNWHVFRFLSPEISS